MFVCSQILFKILFGNCQGGTGTAQSLPELTVPTGEQHPLTASRVVSSQRQKGASAPFRLRDLKRRG